MDIESIIAKLGHNEELVITVTKTDGLIELVKKPNKIEMIDTFDNNATFEDAINFIFS